MASTSQGGGGQGGSNRKGKDPKNVPPAIAEMPTGLPPGKYRLVGWDMDTTGRRLVDEICQIVAYTPRNRFSQYIMPYGDLSPGARRRHNVRVVTIGRYRMLKDTITHKIIKTKSEIFGLLDFLDWMEREKNEDEKVILMYHEPRRLFPTVLINALNQYDLLDRFQSIVAGFTDSYALASEKCKNTLKSVSLRTLSKLLLDDAALVDTATATDRAIATYNIIEQLANQGEQQDFGAGGEGCDENTPTVEMVELACAFARPISTEVEALGALKDLLRRQNTFRAVFAPLLRTTRPHRQRLMHLRRILADAGLLYDQLKDAWHEGRRDGLENLFSALVLTTEPEDLEELVEIFDCHFDLEKVPHYPLIKNPKPTPVEEERDELYLSSDSDSSGSVLMSTDIDLDFNF